MENGKVPERPHQIRIRDDGEHCMVAGCMVKGEQTNLIGTFGSKVAQFGYLRVCPNHCQQLFHGMSATFRSFIQARCAAVAVPSGILVPGK